MRTLRTRDGRKIGNAIVIEEITDGIEPTAVEYLKKTNQKLWLVETDFGNRVKLTDNELNEFFYTEDELNRGQQMMSRNTTYDRWSRDRGELIFRNQNPEPKGEG